MRKKKLKQDHIFLSVLESNEPGRARGDEGKAPCSKREPESSPALPEIPLAVPERKTLPIAPHEVPASAPSLQLAPSVAEFATEATAASLPESSPTGEVPSAVPTAPVLPEALPLAATAQVADTISLGPAEVPRGSSSDLSREKPGHLRARIMTAEPPLGPQSTPAGEQADIDGATQTPGLFPAVDRDFLPQPSPFAAPESGLLISSDRVPVPSFHPTLPEFSFVCISPGSFVMGSPEHEPGRNADETPHAVTITRDFWLQSAPLTQREWKMVTDANPSRFHDETGLLPVENVSWFECQRFIERLNSLGEFRYRLPTEAEWEYACRAGTSAPCPAGEVIELYCGYDDNLDSLGWYCGNSGRTTHPVRLKNPNPWGLYDMVGNVFEWCQDWYAEYCPASQRDPVGPITGPGRVIRGGSWFSNARNCRSASRFSRPPENKSDLVGMRLVRELKP